MILCQNAISRGNQKEHQVSNLFYGAQSCYLLQAKTSGETMPKGRGREREKIKATAKSEQDELSTSTQ